MQSAPTPEQELILNPATQTFETRAVSISGTSPSAAPTLSWSRSDERSNAYDGEFEYKGATIYFKSLSPKRRKELKAQEKGNNARVKELAAHKATLTDEEAQEEVDDQILDLQMGFFEGIVRETVRGWENGPLPYSREAVEDLPLTILIDWALTILEKSVLGKTEAELLKKTSNAS